MGYEPKCGDLVEAIGDKTPGVVTEVFAEPRRVGASSVDVGRVTFTTGGGPLPMPFGSFSGTLSIAPLRPDAVGQRVRFDGHPGAEKWCGTVEMVATGYTWTIARDSTDPLAKKNPHWFARVENLVRIADKAEPMCACGKPAQGDVRGKPVCEVDCPTIPAEAWPNRPLCGRPGHDPACRCDVGWVREVEAEPDVRMGRHDDGEECWIVGDMEWPYSAVDPGASRREAIAAWRACR